MPQLPEGMEPSDALEYVMWGACLRTTLGNPDAMEAFVRDTGHPIPKTSGIDAMIDKACGLDESFITTFIDWFNRTIWGEFNAPLSKVPDANPVGVS